MPLKEIKSRPADHVRALIHDGGEPANIWVQEKAPGVFVLLHDYPDFHPAPGWTVETGGARFTVDSVAGRELHCEENKS